MENGQKSSGGVQGQVANPIEAGSLKNKITVKIEYAKLNYSRVKSHILRHFMKRHSRNAYEFWSFLKPFFCISKFNFWVIPKLDFMDFVTVNIFHFDKNFNAFPRNAAWWRNKMCLFLTCEWIFGDICRTEQDFKGKWFKSFNQNLIRFVLWKEA